MAYEGGLSAPHHVVIEERKGRTCTLRSCPRMAAT